MNLLIVSNRESTSLNLISRCALTSSRAVNWKVLGHAPYHKRFVSIFGRDKLVETGISDLDRHIQEPQQPFSFLQRLDDSSIIIPTDFESLRFLSRSNEAFPGHTLCPLMDERLLDYLDDKHNQQEIAAECGLLSAEEYDYQALHKLPADRRLVIKPRLGAGSKGVVITRDPRQALMYLDSLPAEHRKEQIIQEYIDGEDYYYYALCHEGRIAISGCLKPLRTEKDDLRTCVAASLEDSTVFNGIAEKIVRRYKFSGPISIDFRVCRNSGRTFLVEINPRNGSNCHLFTAVGVNWLLELAKLAAGRYAEGQAPVAIRPSGVWLFSYRSALVHLACKLKAPLPRILLTAIKAQLLPDLQMFLRRFAHRGSLFKRAG